MTQRPLISVHVAKAGGSSLLQTFKTAFGDRLLLDYSENPANPLSLRVLDPARYFSRQVHLDPEFACAHGHFHPGKYRMTAETVLCTILRDPVENIISIYAFWKTLPKGHDGLHDYFIDNRLSIVELAKLPLLRRLFSETYFGGFDMGRFDVVGRHQTRGAALEKISSLIGVGFDTTIRVNVTPPSAERHALDTDPRLRRALEDILADDIGFYEKFAR